MKMLSGSSRIVRPAWKLPAPSHVHAVERWCRCAASSERSFAKATTAPTKDTEVDPVAIQPAVRPEIRMPASVIASVAASGVTRQIQAAAITLASERLQPVDVEREAPPRHCHDQSQPDDDLGRGDRHHGDREHLTRALAVTAGERDQREVVAVSAILFSIGVLGVLLRRSPIEKRIALTARYQL